MTNLSIKKEARKKLRVAISDALECFDLYGMGIYIPSSQGVIMKAVERYVKEVK